MRPKSSGGRARTRRTWTVLSAIVSITRLSTPEQQGEERRENVKDVRLDAPPLQNTKPRAEPGVGPERRHHAPLEHGVGDLAVEPARAREEGESLGTPDL